MCENNNVDNEVRDAQHEHDLKGQSRRDAENAVQFIRDIMSPFIEGSSSDKTPRRKA